MNRLALVALPSVGFAALMWWTFATSGRENPAKSSRSQLDVNSASRVEERILALESNSRRMRQELALTRARIVDPADYVHPHDEKQANDAQQEKSAVEDAVQQRAETSAREPYEEVESRREASIAAFEDNLRQQAMLESVDRARTTDVEAVFDKVVAEVGESLELENVACGTSLCSVTVSHEYDLAHSKLTTALQAHRDHIRRALIRRHPNPSGGYLTTYYFSRPGESLAHLDKALVGEYIEPNK